MTLERHPAVVASDLPRIYAFIARDDVIAAERVLEGVELTFDQLRRQPECGVQYRTGNRRLVGVRMVPVAGFENYLIFYRLEAGVIRVLYVLHGARYLRRLFRREPRA